MKFNKPENNRKIAVVHDHLGFRGGGERTSLLLAIDSGADFITAYKAEDTYEELQRRLGSRLIALSSRVIQTRVARFFWLRFLFWRGRSIFKQYDILIASGQTATEAVAKYGRKSAMRMVYTHTTPRRVFDQYEFSKQMYRPCLRPAYALFVRYWKRKYLSALARINYNIANSEHVRQRVRKYVGGDVNAVVWPPILTEKFKWISQGDYYLSWSRIDEAKRVELVARAFRDMPDKKLIIASGGPRLGKVREIAGSAANIEIKGWISDEDLYGLAGNCIAAVYVPIDEDAGMTHLEANSAGKPFLGVREGGLIESSINGRTGLLVRENPGVEDIIQGIKAMTPAWCLERKEECESQASKYDQGIFLSRMKDIIRKNDPAIPILGIDASRWEDPRFPGESRRTGVEVVAKNIIENLIPLALKDGRRIRLYAPRTIGELPLEYQRIIPGGRGWTRKRLSRELKYSPVDYYFTPSYYIPSNAPGKSCAILHDVLFRTHPRRYSFGERLKQEYAAGRNVKRASHLFTVSEHSRREIMREYRISPEKISVIPLGCPAGNNPIKSGAREKSVLYIGRIEKKKSIDILLKAFGRFCKNFPDWSLNLAGAPGFGYEQIKALVAELGLERRVNILGYISDENKWSLLARTGLFVHPSSHEGSSLPLLEAWQSEAPAIAAGTELMRELGRDAAFYFRSGDPEDLAEKMERLAGDPRLRQELVEKGAGRLKLDSWKNAAEIIINVIAAR